MTGGRTEIALGYSISEALRNDERGAVKLFKHLKDTGFPDGVNIGYDYTNERSVIYRAYSNDIFYYEKGEFKVERVILNFVKGRG